MSFREYLLEESKINEIFGFGKPKKDKHKVPMGKYLGSVLTKKPTMGSVKKDLKDHFEGWKEINSGLLLPHENGVAMNLYMLLQPFVDIDLFTIPAHPDSMGSTKSKEEKDAYLVLRKFKNSITTGSNDDYSKREPLIKAAADKTYKWAKKYQEIQKG